MEHVYAKCRRRITYQACEFRPETAGGRTYIDMFQHLLHNDSLLDLGYSESSQDVFDGGSE
jgi:hypothetical protein